MGWYNLGVILRKLLQSLVVISGVALLGFFGRADAHVLKRLVSSGPTVTASPSPSAPPLLPGTAPHEFDDEIERDFTLRTIGHLQVTNLRGSITVQGWALDRIRVKAHRKIIASDAAEAKDIASSVDFRYREVDGDIELSAEYGRGLTIEQRLEEREHPRSAMDIVVYAPANFRLRAWAVTGGVSVKAWRAPLEVRSQSGKIRLDDLKLDSVSVLCPACSIEAHDVTGSFRCLAGSEPVTLDQIHGDQVYVESTSGAQHLSGISGNQLYITRSGEIDGRDLSGHFEFHSQSGDVSFEASSGFVSGRTETGNIRVQMKKWEFLDKALFESSRGNIQLLLPDDFAADVDLWSVFGKTSLGFLLKPLNGPVEYGPQPTSHLRGRIADGTEQLRVFSRYGDIQVSRFQ